MRCRTHRSLLTALVVLVALTGSPPLAAQDDGVLDRTPQDCIAVNRISRTKVVDDKTILFYMRGRQIYQNILERDCPRLERENRFMYEVRSFRLCDIDTITVLDRFGAGFGRGFTCRLGQFHPVSAAEAEEIELISEGEIAPEGVFEIEAVELPPDDEQEEQADSE
ncbi:hypothetical protein [Candidatus Rariloculus sp.]|uniref:hypothetical protein n=1 Tax=Candidatus Rariloculus sp. TaxID=3101265 RepID=UPI003D11271F